MESELIACKRKWGMKDEEQLEVEQSGGDFAKHAQGPQFNL